jgi:hypothetical protein
MPQRLWWMSMTSVVFSSRWEMISDLITSSLTTPPALRMTCASPGLSPSSEYTSSRASMQAITATPLAGRGARS